MTKNILSKQRYKHQFAIWLTSYVCLLSQFGFAQNSLFGNSIFKSSIETVLLTKNTPNYDPIVVIPLDGSYSLKLSFDHLVDRNEFFNYTFIHCNSKWEPSSLQKMEYIEGNPIGQINNFVNSTNTYQSYVHYTLVFPNQDIKFTKSGNYILKVFRDFDEEDVYITRRFMVLDSKTNVDATVNSATKADKRFSHQEIDFEVDYEKYPMPNPMLDVNAVILQNNSWQNAITGLKPMFINGNKLIFNYEEENLFPGSNEFRWFDMRTLRYFSQNVVDKFQDTIINAVLAPDEKRGSQVYLFFRDFNGKRLVNNKDGRDVSEDGDYVKVHFNLMSKDLSDQGDVYIYGELSDWKLQDKFKMTYDPNNERYYRAVKLKQSYYNYQYVTAKDDGVIDFTFTEGNHYETENDYMILIYHKNVFLGYDELIGFSLKNTGVNRN